MAYRWVVRAFPRDFRNRFGEGLEQTFHDLCREHATKGQGLHVMAIRAIGETLVQISKQRSMGIRQMRKGVAAVIGLTGSILLIPAVAMPFTDEVRWTNEDFLVAGVLLMLTGLTAEFLWRKSGSFGYRAGSLLAVFIALLVTWVNLAVGIIGQEGSAANVLYFGVILVSVSGAILVRLRPAGMAVVLNVAALLTAAIPVFAHAVWTLPLDKGALVSFVFNCFVALALAVSARLFRASVSASHTGGIPASTRQA